VFDARLSGLVLAEVGFETTDAMDQSFDLPPWVIREVSETFASPAVPSLASREVRLPN
jgi:CYTH domain-containing protein